MISSARLTMLLAWASLAVANVSAGPPCRVRVVDEETGWPVPLVTLRTVHEVAFHTDNAGVVALDVPELEGVETWLHLEADGYELAPDGFGYRGFRLVPQRGGRHEVRVRRTVAAKRLGRLTGGGMFAESQKVGEELDWAESGVMGCDSVQTAWHRGRLHWAWGDTQLARYPLGIFHMLGATTAGRPFDSLEPPLRPRFEFHRDRTGNLRAVAELDGPGPTWVSGLASLPDASGQPRLVGHFVKIDPPLTVYRSGLCVWDDDENRFVERLRLWDRDGDGDRASRFGAGDVSSPPANVPSGHAIPWRDEDGGRWLLFGDPFPTLRVPATFEGWSDPDSWVAIRPPTHLWSAAAAGTGDTRRVEPHRGGVAWHPWRKRWVTVFGEKGGEPSYLGEIWYAEAHEPTGPWGPAVKVLSHRRHTFYNPKVHSGFTDADPPVLLFEGTYTKAFSRDAQATPRYEYNQILYRLNLDDPALAPAAIPEPPNR